MNAKGVAVVLALATLAGAARAERPWPILLGTYWSKLAGPAASFELTSDGRTWTGVPGDTIPGTTWLVRAIHFMPSGVILAEPSRLRACAVLPRQSPWYQPLAWVADDGAPIAQPAARPEPPPEPDTAEFYAELAREYTFVERYSEAEVCKVRAEELGAKSGIREGSVTYKERETVTPGGATGTFQLHKVDDDDAPAPAASASPGASPASDSSPSPDASPSPAPSPSPAN